MRKGRVYLRLGLAAIAAGVFFILFLHSTSGPEHPGDVILEVELRTSDTNVFSWIVNGKAHGRIIHPSPHPEKLTVALPRERIRELKLVLGEGPAQVKISAIGLRSFRTRRTWRSPEIKRLVLRHQGISNLAESGQELLVQSRGSDAHLVFSENLHALVHAQQADRLLPVLIATTLGILLFLLVMALDPGKPFRLLRGRPFSLLAILFFAILFSPLADRWLKVSARIPLRENRTLAPKPPFRFDAFWGFPRTFQEYHADHFGLRSLLVKSYNSLRIKVLHDSPNPSVLLGKEGWLYLAQEGEVRNVIEYYRGLHPFSLPELEQWRRVLVQRRDWLRTRGIDYLLVWVPDKTSIYPEFLPSQVHQARPTTRLDELLAHLSATTDLPLLDLRPVLLEGKKHHQVFLRTDTHWNDRGGYLAYRAIIERLQPRFPGLVPIPPERLSFVPQIFPGSDLAGMLAMSESTFETTETVQFDFQKRAVEIPPPQASNSWTSWGITETPGSGLPRAVMFRDSYAHWLMDYLSENFARIFYVWDREMHFDAQLIEREKPDLVIEEIAERFLVDVTPKNPDSLSRPSR